MGERERETLHSINRVENFILHSIYGIGKLSNEMTFMRIYIRTLLTNGTPITRNTEEEEYESNYMLSNQTGITSWKWSILIFEILMLMTVLLWFSFLFRSFTGSRIQNEDTHITIVKCLMKTMRHLLEKKKHYYNNFIIKKFSILMFYITSIKLKIK